jgi:hypothetical protein
MFKSSAVFIVTDGTKFLVQQNPTSTNVGTVIGGLTVVTAPSLTYQIWGITASIVGRT